MGQRGRWIRDGVPCWVAAALCALACTTPSGTDSSSAALSPDAAPLAVDFSGCERVLAGPVCELGPGQPLTLWMADSFRGFELRAGAALSGFEERPVAGGYQIRVTPDAASGELGLWQTGRSRWRLALAPHRASERLAAVHAARARGDAAAIAVQQAAARQAGSALDAVLAEGALARLELRGGRVEQASILLERTTGELFSLGQLSEASRDVFARLFILLQREGAVAEAQRWLERWREPVSRYPLGRALLADHEGMLRATLGEPVAALHTYREAERAYERLGEAAHARRVRQEQVGLLSDIGETETAQTLAASLLPPLDDEPVCTKAQLYILQAWLTLLLAEQAPERGRELPALLAQSEEWEKRCADPEVLVTGLVNRGLWALHQGDLARAAELDRELGALPPRQTPELRAWVAELRARFALARGRRREAEQLFEMEAWIGRSAGRLDPELRALLGLMAVADAQGASGRADALLAEAVAALERAERWGAFGSLVYSQFSSRQRAAQELARRWLARDQPGEAWRVALAAYRAALGAQARASQSADEPSEQRDTWVGEYRQRREALDRAADNDWQLSSAELRVAVARRHVEREQLEALLQRAAALEPASRAPLVLPSPAPGEYWLLLFEDATLGGAWALGHNGVATRAARLTRAALETPAAGDHPLLAPFAAELASAEQIVILPAGKTRSLELETFSLGGRPLSAYRLAFGAALGALPTAPAVFPRHASVSADPRGDLPFSRREAEWVADVLHIPENRRLSGTLVTGTQLLAQLESSDFFHFAGHARRSGPSEEAVLLLANGAELQPWELFSLRSVPREVVLSACEAGDGHESGFGVGWGLAQVFLALGAETVIAPLRRVDDAAAYALQHRVYEGMKSGLPLREAFWAAQRIQPQPAASFRMFIR